MFERICSICCMEQGTKLTGVLRCRAGFKLYTAMSPLGYKLMIHTVCQPTQTSQLRVLSSVYKSRTTLLLKMMGIVRHYTYYLLILDIIMYSTPIQVRRSDLKRIQQIASVLKRITFFFLQEQTII